MTGTLPTSDELWKLLNQDPEHFEKPGQENDKETLIWYYDCWLTAVVGKVYWGEKYRHYKLETDKVPMGKDKKERSLCSAADVAFGLLTYDNCRDRWIAMFELKKRDPGKSICDPV